MSERQKDLKALLLGVSFAVLGPDFQILELSPPARQLISLLPDDVSGQIGDAPSTSVPNLVQLVKQIVPASGVPPEHVVDSTGKSYRVRILPYRRGDKPEGYIVTVLDSSFASRLSKENTLLPE